jgi:hypothetical protein
MAADGNPTTESLLGVRRFAPDCSSSGKTMRIDKSFRPCNPFRTLDGWLTLVPMIAFAALAVSAQAQTVGPITPHASQTPDQPAPARATQTPASAQNSQNDKISLAGMWKMNRDESDDPRQKLEQASSGGGGGWGQAPSGGGGGWGGWGGGGWGIPGSGRGGGWNRTSRPLPEAGTVDTPDFSQLTIEQSDSNTKVMGATGRVLAQTADNSTAQDKQDKNSPHTTKKLKNSADTPAIARWQGSELVTTVDGPRGIRTTRIYGLSGNGKQLYVTTRLESPRLNQPVSIRFVYDSGSSNTH